MKRKSIVLHLVTTPFIILSNATKEKLQVLQHLPCDCVVASYFPALDIRWLVEEHAYLIGRVAQGVRGRSQFPTFLNNPSQSRAVGLDPLVVEQAEYVIEAEINGIDIPALHYVHEQLGKFYLDTVTVGSYYLLQRRSVGQPWGEPHTAFFFGG